jgi:DNA-binding IclR family transcriptional regulator
MPSRTRPQAAPDGQSPRPGGTERIVVLLGLFTEERPVWTVEEIAEVLRIGLSTAYRHVSALSDAGWLAAVAPARYGLGPAIIAADRLAQRTDPLLGFGSPIMDALASRLPDGSTVVLARLFGDSAMCVRQVLTPGPQPAISYERGRPMALFRGAAGKAMLGLMPTPKLRRLYPNHAETIAAGGLGDTLDAFLLHCARIRREGHAMTRGELDRGRLGIAAPVVTRERRVIGSLGAAMPDGLQPSALASARAAIISASRDLSIRLSEEPQVLAASA